LNLGGTSPLSFSLQIATKFSSDAMISFPHSIHENSTEQADA
jgi:hypothetical protein